jgi:ribosomal protein S24E
MDIEIQTKTKNPLLNRTDVHFIIVHTGEQTPKRELVRNELAEKLKVKKDQIIIDNMQSHFGLSHTQGYAKVYKNTKEAQSFERNHILKRNHAAPPQDKAKEEKPAEETPPKPKKPEETPPSEPPKEEQPPQPEKPKEESPAPKQEKQDEKPPEEKKE